MLVSRAGVPTFRPSPSERAASCSRRRSIATHTARCGPGSDRQIAIQSVDYGMEINWGIDDAMQFDGRLDLVKAAIRKFGNGMRGGYDLFLHSNAPPGSGLGSSSSMMVTLIGLLREYHSLPLSDYEVARLAYVVERQELGLKGGMQDQYASTFGGFNFIEFASDHVIVNPLRISRQHPQRARDEPAARLHRSDPRSPTTSSRTRRSASRQATSTRSMACGCRRSWPSR